MPKKAVEAAREAALLVADVYELAGLLRREGERVAATRNQTQARWQLLSAVSDPPLTVPQVARRLGITRQAVQRVANNLVADGLVQRLANPDHRTSPLLGLTDDGHRTLAEITRAASRLNLELSEALGEREMAATRRNIKVLIGLLQQS